MKKLIHIPSATLVKYCMVHIKSEGYFKTYDTESVLTFLQHRAVITSYDSEFHNVLITTDSDSVAIRNCNYMNVLPEHLAIVEADE